MKKIYAILMMAAALAACSREQQAVTEAPDVPQEPETFQTYTLTIKATKGDDAITRAVGLSTDGTAINASWKQGDEVEVSFILYDKLGTLTAQSNGAETTLTGTLTVPQEAELKKGDKLNLWYNFDAKFSAQDGTLPYISNHLDMASCEVTVDDIDAWILTK